MYRWFFRQSQTLLCFCVLFLTRINSCFLVIFSQIIFLYPSSNFVEMGGKEVCYGELG